jgi:RHS repeat-associated protein
MFRASEAGLSLARFRAYDPELGRWLSRDPLKAAELNQGPNLYVYVQNNPVNQVDPLGLCCEAEQKRMEQTASKCGQAGSQATEQCAAATKNSTPNEAAVFCANAFRAAHNECQAAESSFNEAAREYSQCAQTPCGGKVPCSIPLDFIGSAPPPDNVGFSIAEDLATNFLFEVALPAGDAVVDAVGYAVTTSLEPAMRGVRRH